MQGNIAHRQRYTSLKAQRFVSFFLFCYHWTKETCIGHDDYSSFFLHLNILHIQTYSEIHFITASLSSSSREKRYYLSNASSVVNPRRRLFTRQRGNKFPCKWSQIVGFRIEIKYLRFISLSNKKNFQSVKCGGERRELGREEGGRVKLTMGKQKIERWGTQCVSLEFHVGRKLEGSFSEDEVSGCARVVRGEVLLPEVGEFHPGYFLTLCKWETVR